MVASNDGMAVAQTSVATPATLPAAGYYRWIICSLLFFAATVNYVDRQVISLLKPTFQAELRWNEIDYSNIVAAFCFIWLALWVALYRRPEEHRHVSAAE